ncbi:carboxypeptidase-like regulatory domain-containing protein [uncultured Lacinutrix sp.]|uniref:carboxypeptidase-like regulatory domain-containing protein n=1 Tax=uncultured Lacinutrix sp. TaxID=574032 RepID=UPI002632171B|nr:carboxypeptidase-like regulatory domain-containing protein [uncultured Lacinutrix sp.]
MAQSIQYDRYPKFVADQVLTEKSLNQMFGYLEEQQRLTRSTLIGIGILCGMNVSVNNTGTALTISQGVGVTSKGYLVPFPETTYTFYNDKFSAEQEFFYRPFLNPDDTQKFPLHLLHNDGAAEIQIPLSADFLEDKVVVIFVELLKVDNKNCDPDSCDDKGCTVEVAHRPLLIAKDHINELIFNEDDVPFLHEPSCIEWPEIKMPKYNVPSTLLLSSPAILKGFLNVLTSDFILNIENVLGAAYNSFGYYIEEEFPSNPFSGLRNNFAFLFNGTITAQQLLHIQYYYDFFSDLIMAYEEMRNMCNDCLSLCCPNEALFPRHLILGDVVPSPDNFRHHWIPSPAFSCGHCSEGRIKFLLKKIALLIQKVSIPRTTFQATNQRRGVQITPSNYGSIPLSDKAIPYYYDIVGAPNELYNNWNLKKTKTKKGNTNLSFDTALYNTNPYFNDPLSYDLEPYNFLRVEGHVGMDWKAALSQVNEIKKEKRLPIDVVALNGDIFALIQSLLTSAAPLAEIISGNKDIVGEIRCYFADIESQYDAHAAELRCTIIKVMAYFYNLKKVNADQGPVPTNNLPQSELVRKEFPNYRTPANTYGADFDTLYAPFKNQPYVVPEVFISSAVVPIQLLSPVYVMYYLEKIYEALPDGLVELRIADITQRLEDASQFAAYTLLAIDNADTGNSDFELPSLWEESLDAVIRICKAEVFNVLYRNFLINYVLFIANQTFALYAYKNPGVQHKAGVTTGGTLILVYHDKPEIRDTTRRVTGSVRAVTGAPIPGVSVIEKGTTNGTITDVDGNFIITVTNANAILVVSFVGYKTEEVSTTGTNSVVIILSQSTVTSATGSFASSASFEAAQPGSSALNQVFGATRSGKRTRRSFMDLKNNNESVRATGLNDVFEIIDGAKEDDLSNQELVGLINQFQEGTVIADFFVPNMCKSSCTPMNFMVVNPEDLPELPTPNPDTETPTTEIVSSDLPTINLRWGVEKRDFNSLIAFPADNNWDGGNPPEENSIDGEVHLIEVNMLGSNRKWLEYNPKLHLLRYKPKKRETTTSGSGFRKEASSTLNYFGRINEFDVTDTKMTIDIRPDRYFSVEKGNRTIKAMGLSSIHHNMYFYLVLSIEKDGELIFGEHSKTFKVTINEGNLLSFHIS